MQANDEALQSPEKNQHPRDETFASAEFESDRPGAEPRQLGPIDASQPDLQSQLLMTVVSTRFNFPFS